MIKKSITALAILLTLATVVSIFPSAVNAQADAPRKYDGLVKCDGVYTIDETGKRSDKNEVLCDFNTLVLQAKTIINWLFFLAVPIAIALFAYAGFLYMTGVEANMSKARSMFSTVAIGFILMMIAWFVVYTIIYWLTKPDQGFLIFLGGK